MPRRKRAASQSSGVVTRSAKQRKTEQESDTAAVVQPVKTREALPKETKIDVFSYLNRRSLDRVVITNRQYRDIVLGHMAHICLRLIVSAEVSDLGLRRGTFRSTVKGLLKDHAWNRQEHAMQILELNYESQSAYKTACWLTQCLRSSFIRQDLLVHVELGQFREFLPQFGPVYVQGTLDIYGDLWRRIALTAFLDRFPQVTDVRTMTTAREEITDNFLAYCEARRIRSFRFHGISCPAVQKTTPTGSFHLTVREDLTADRQEPQDMSLLAQFKVYDSHSTRRYQAPGQFFVRLDTLSKYLMVWWRCEADNDY
ncbi:hypothetical protein AAVH_15083 [Aphelenchoides avenae]|nr:hypothetical protein AAVH_15083 [Aphelenchus avenae]